MADTLDMQRFAIQAKSLLEDPAFRRVYEKLYMGAIDDIRHSQPEQTAKRDEAYWRLRTLEDLDKTLNAEISAVKLAEKRERAG